MKVTNNKELLILDIKKGYIEMGEINRKLANDFLEIENEAMEIREDVLKNDEVVDTEKTNHSAE